MSDGRIAWPGGEGEPLTAAAARSLAALLQPLAEPARLRILSIVAANDPRPTTVTELVDAVGLSQATVSHHLKHLLQAGFVSAERAGNWNLYRANADAYADVVQRLSPDR